MKRTFINQQNLRAFRVTSTSHFKVDQMNNISKALKNDNQSKTKILYDGECSICRVEINLLQKFAKKEHLEYVGISLRWYWLCGTLYGFHI